MPKSATNPVTGWQATNIDELGMENEKFQTRSMDIVDDIDNKLEEEMNVDNTMEDKIPLTQ